MKKILILLVIVLAVLFLLMPVSFPVEFYCYKEGQPHTDIGLPGFPGWRLLLYKVIGVETYCKTKEECPKLNSSDCDSKIYCKKVYYYESICNPRGGSEKEDIQKVDCYPNLQGKKIPYCVSVF